MDSKVEAHPTFKAKTLKTKDLQVLANVVEVEMVVIKSISIHETVPGTSPTVLAIWMVAKGDQNLDLEAVQGQKV